MTAAAPVPDWEDDGRAGWFPTGPLDVECDPTSRHPETHPPVRLRWSNAVTDDARIALLAAANYADLP